MVLPLAAAAAVAASAAVVASAAVAAAAEAARGGLVRGATGPREWRCCV